MTDVTPGVGIPPGPSFVSGVSDHFGSRPSRTGPHELREHAMQHNENNVDRIVRVVIAAAAVALAAVVGFGTVLGIVALVVAAVMVATAASGFCPLYALFGVSTCPNRPADR